MPAEKANELWRNYQLYVEQYYDLLKLNSEAREYDFKKNLELKLRLCEAAEKLDQEEDVISAFHQLQKLHQEFRETGPVSKELREEIWTRFKAASTVINNKHLDIRPADQRMVDRLAHIGFRIITRNHHCQDFHKSTSHFFPTFIPIALA